MESIAILLSRAGIKLDELALERLWQYHNLIRGHNQDRDLTRIVGFEPMVVKHYIDCLMVLQLTSFYGTVLDIGTGAGFPGIPLQIARPDLKLILAEHRPRRCNFLRLVIGRLGLENTEVFEHKVVSQSFQQPVQMTICRALETIDKTLLRTSACTSSGARLVFMKGPNVDPELEVFHRRFSGAFHILQDKAYVLPGTPYERRLIVIEKK